MNRHESDTTARNVAIVGGGALLVWLLFRGRGWGLGGGPIVGNAPASTTVDGSASASGSQRLPCRVRIDRDGIHTDGVSTDLPAMTAHCRAAGGAEVFATGDAVSGVVADAIDSLRTAGVTVWATGDVWNSADTPRRRPV